MPKGGFLLLLFYFSCLQSFSQQKEFEGVLNYKVEIKSKVPVFSDNVMKGILAKGNFMTGYIKEGNYRQSSGGNEIYFINASQKAYYKFKNVDTLYFLDYSTDIFPVPSVSKLKEEVTIAKYPCNAIELKTEESNTKYFYAPSLYINPAHDENNKIGGYNALIKETSAVWLSSIEESKTYSEKITATRIEQKEIDKSVFDLPNLPLKIFTLETVTKPPEYLRNGGWKNYLMKFTNNEVGAKYIKIPKGETSATQSVLVSFLITENGEVQQVKVENPKEVNSKVAKEAVRVVEESGKWKPGTIYGVRIPQYLKQSITFSVIK